MSLKKFLYVFVFCLLLNVVGNSVFAQNADMRAKQSRLLPDTNDLMANEDDPVIVSVAEVRNTAEDIKPANPLIAGGSARLMRFLPLISAAIDNRLGSRYRWGATGPHTFDCSGFVWATFHAAGIEFERGSARNLYSRFEAPTTDDQYKFGTLVFFNHLSHVGIVADQNGFYHASRHHGVVYAPFAGYWGKHITGFRRVPLPAQAPKTSE